MARIYISYNNKDSDLAKVISSGLKDLGHEIAIDVDMLKAGDSMRGKLQTGIRNSDGIVVLVTENSLNSQYVLTEIGTARTLSETNFNKFFIPVIVGNLSIPPILQDIFCLLVGEGELNLAVEKIHASIVSFQSSKEQEQEQVKQFEINVDKYVGDVIRALEKREKSNKLTGQIWYYHSQLSIS